MSKSDDPDFSDPDRADEPPPPPSPPPRSSDFFDQPSLDQHDEVDAAVEIYLELAKRCGWRTARKLTPSRRRALTARLREVGGLEAWRQALQRAEKSKFLLGKTEKKFQPGIDFFCDPEKFNRLLEGAYDDRSTSSQEDQEYETWTVPETGEVRRVPKAQKSRYWGS